MKLSVENYEFLLPQYSFYLLPAFLLKVQIPFSLPLAPWIISLAHVTDASGRTIAKVSGGMVTKHSRLKANPTIAMFIAKRISENMKEKGIKSLYVRIRAKTGSTGPGPGANAIIKSLSREGFKIINILDTTRVPRGVPKKQGGRRGRRV
ncbi:MAG: 30S ribosomal protein S11 [Bacteroidales bacterium]